MEFPVLTDLIFKDCSKLSTIKIKANLLIELNITNCSKLNSFLVECPHLQILTLRDTLTVQNYNNIIDFVNSNFKNSLKYLDIGFSNIKNYDFNDQKDLILILPNIETLKATNLLGIENFALFLTHCKVLEINFSSLKLITGQMIKLQTITPEPPPPQISNDILLKLKKIQILLFGLEDVKVCKPFFEDYFKQISAPESLFNVIKNNENSSNSEINQKSKFSIHSKNCSQFVIFFLDLFNTQWGEYDCFSKLNSQISNFKFKNSKEHYQHITFILITSKSILSEYNEKAIGKLNDIKKKFNFHYQVDLILEISKKETFELFCDQLFDIFQKTLF
ncbi:hypothetical protein ACTFIZ_005682 [Dictyostelium cf. discoideum]